MNCACSSSRAFKFFSVHPYLDERALSKHVFFLVVFSAPPSITGVADEKADVQIGKDLTLTCNASGDPHPNIAWTKDGVPASQFNASGYLLHLVNIQKKDAGSYICTASNGYGDHVMQSSCSGFEPL